jgi:hypothetical protein
MFLETADIQPMDCGRSKTARLVSNRMIVRIRLGRGTQVGKKPRRKRRFAAGVAGMLTPAAVLAAAFAVWRIASDMNWTGSFAIPRGFFSHWQVWLGGAAILQTCAHLLNRYAKRGETAAT